MLALVADVLPPLPFESQCPHYAIVTTLYSESRMPAQPNVTAFNREPSKWMWLISLSPRKSVPIVATLEESFATTAYRPVWVWPSKVVLHRALVNLSSSLPSSLLSTRCAFGEMSRRARSSRRVRGASDRHTPRSLASYIGSKKRSVQRPRLTRGGRSLQSQLDSLPRGRRRVQPLLGANTDE